MNIKLKTGCIYAFISADDTASIVLKKMNNRDNGENFNITCLNGKENVSKRLILRWILFLLNICHNSKRESKRFTLLLALV